MGPDEDKILLDYKRPPVAEVILSVQFEPLARLDAPHIGLYWSSIRDRSPRAEQHPPVARVIEAFGPRGFGQPVITLDFAGAPQVPRCWFLDAKGDQLVQVQQDRFMRNWRKAVTSYPRYETLRRSFEEEFVRFDEFVRLEQLGALRPDQCEVTYINHIATDGLWQRHSELGAILSLWCGDFSERWANEPEDANVRLRFPITNNQQEPLGRVHVDIQPAYRTDDRSPIFVMSLTARGAPSTADLPGALAFLDLGRLEVAKVFRSITTDRAKKLWQEAE